MQVAELFARLGFRIDNSGLNNFRNNLNNLANNTQSTVNRMFNSFRDFSRGTQQSLQQVNNTIHQTNDLTFRMSHNFKRLSVGLASALTVNSFKNMIFSASELNDKFLSLKALTQTIGKDFENLKQAVLQAGDITTFTPQEMADTAIGLSQAGLNSNQIMGSILPIAQFSEATRKVMLLSDYAELVANTFGRFNLNVDDTNKIVDTFTSAINSANLNANDFSYTMKYVGSIAQNAGLSLEEASALIATTATVTKNTMAGTSLAMILTQLLDPKTDVSQKLKNYGIDLYQGGKLKNIGTILNDISRYLKFLNSQGKSITPFVKDLVGQNALSEALFLFQNPQLFQEKLLRIQSGKGITQTTAEASMGSFTKAQSNLEGAITNLKDVIFTKLEPTLTNLTNIFSDIVKGTTKLIDKLASFKVVMGAFLILLTSRLLPLKLLVNGLQKVAFFLSMIMPLTRRFAMPQMGRGFNPLIGAGGLGFFSSLKKYLIPITALLLGFTLIVEDLYMFFTGSGKTVVGDFFKEGNQAVILLTHTIESLMEDLDILAKEIGVKLGFEFRDFKGLLVELTKYISEHLYIGMLSFLTMSLAFVKLLAKSFNAFLDILRNIRNEIEYIKEFYKGFVDVENKGTQTSVLANQKQYLENLRKNDPTNYGFIEKLQNNLLVPLSQSLYGLKLSNKQGNITNNINITTTTDNPLLMGKTIKNELRPSHMGVF